MKSICISLHPKLNLTQRAVAKELSSIAPIPLPLGTFGTYIPVQTKEYKHEKPFIYSSKNRCMIACDAGMFARSGEDMQTLQVCEAEEETVKEDVEQGLKGTCEVVMVVMNHQRGDSAQNNRKMDELCVLT